MLTAEQINSIHRLHWAEHWSVRKIAVIFTWHAEPSPSIWSHRSAAPLAGNVPANWIRSSPPLPSGWSKTRTPVPWWLRNGLARLASRWSEHLERLLTRGASADRGKRAYVRMEPGPGNASRSTGAFRCPSLQGHARKLYAFCLVECHSRKLFVEFTHSQSFETSCAVTSTPSSR